MMPLVRRSLAVTIAALLAGVFGAVATSVSAGAAPVKGSLSVVSVTDAESGFGAPVKGRSFNVVVEVLDAGQPTTVTKATTIVLEEVSGPGVLGGNTTAVIPRNGSRATIAGATYSEYANGVVFRVRVASGVDLEPDEVTVDVAATAAVADATRGKPLKVTDSNCSAPTPELPTCGSQLLLPNGADGRVTMSAGSCDGLRPENKPCLTVGSTEALVVTTVVDIDGLYTKKAPATLVMACDKAICGQSGAGLPQLAVIYTFNNDGQLTLTAPACPAKGVLGDNQEICVDYVQSSRSQGDLYTYVLFDHDLRLSHP